MNVHKRLGEGLSASDISALLDRVDERIAHHALHSNIGVSGSQLGIGYIQVRSSIRELRARIQQLQTLRAPLFIIDGGGFRNMIKRLANLPIAALSSKQIIHNRELLEVLAMILNELDSMSRQASYTEQLTAVIEQQQSEIIYLKAALAELDQRVTRSDELSKDAPS